MQLTKRLILATLAGLYLSTATLAANFTRTIWRAIAAEADIYDYSMVANLCHRCLLNSPMLPAMPCDADGGLTLAIQHDTLEPYFDKTWWPGEIELVQ